MNPLLLALLAQMNQSNQNQNPLAALLGNQQDPTQQLIAALSGATGMQQNAINPQLLALLTGNQQQQQDPMAQLLQMLQGNAQQQGGNQDLSKLLEFLGGEKPKSDLEKLADLLKANKADDGKDKQDDENDIITQLINKNKEQKSNETDQAALTDAIKFNMGFNKFIEDNESLFPDWFAANEVLEGVDKWAKNETDRAQGLAAATVKAFFKNEDMLDLLEERDRTTVQDKITKSGLKSHEIDRSIAWPVLERAIHNHKQLSDSSSNPMPTGKDEGAIADFGKRFESPQGQSDESAA
ncbi:hypothetical protein ACP6H1_21765 [Vibrio harveyi]|uniref:hypothetical protein n=1 Tax=Vibrio harveyi TaxID=669 RepID=UPI003CE8078D